MRCEACGHENIDGARFCATCGAVLPVQSPSNENAMVGQVIGGRYRITGVIGEGGMGVVYVGEQQMGSTIRKVAIKTLHPHLSQDPSVLARFHRECGTVAQLEHPNTIKVYDFGAMPDGTLYIAMEYVKGKPLAQAIEHTPLSPDRVVHIMRQICGALDEAHQQGVIHRDLKPENIILTDRAGETDFVKVLDFGIAARTEKADATKEQKLTQQGMVLGTPPYMSPEQFTGKPLDARSDIYSLGIMAYEMLAGRLPFEAATPWEWATRHMTAQPTPLEVAVPNANIPGAMREAITRALSKDREQRQATAREFFAELSGGGRVTIEHPPHQPAAVVAGSTGTAAMAAAPDFGNAGGGGPAKTAPGTFGVTPGHAPPGNVAPAYGAPPAAPAHVAMPPPTRPGAGKSGGKGLLIGLGALGAVLLIAIVVVAARSSGDDGDPTGGTINITPTGTGTGAGGGTVIQPVTDPTAPPADPTADQPPTNPTADPPPVGKPTGTGTAKPPPKPSETAKPSEKPAGDPCEACLSAARSGNISSAGNNYQRCSDAGKKAQCASVVRASANSAAKTAARNGNCSQAKAIVGAAQAMGLGSAVATALNGTSCR